MTSAFPLNVFPMIPLGGHFDPPPAPPGYDTEVLRDAVQGVVTHYRHVPSVAQIPTKRIEDLVEIAVSPKGVRG